MITLYYSSKYLIKAFNEANAKYLLTINYNIIITSCLYYLLIIIIIIKAMNLNKFESL